MNSFILKDNFIEAIKKNKEKLKDFYNKNIDNVFFNKFPYDNSFYYLNIQHPKKVVYDWQELKKQNELFSEIFEDNNIIVPSAGISRIMPSPRNRFVAHKHIYDVDLYIYHYILTYNSECGIIINNEYLPYHDDLVFGFKADKKHIVFNFGDTVKDSYVFYILNPKYTLKDWYDVKINNIVKHDYGVVEMNKKYASRQIKKFTGF